MNLADQLAEQVLTLAGEIFTRSLDNLLYSVQSGKTGFEKAFGVPFFDWLARHPTEASMFSETMVGLNGAEHAAVAAAYDFSEFGTVIDVGGATGNFLTAILGRYSKPHGILFDLPHVIADASQLIRSRGLMNRIKMKVAAFSRPSRQAATFTCFRTSFTIGARRNVLLSSVTVVA